VARLQRTQVYLEPEVSQALDRLARRRGTTRSDLIRLATRKYVEEEQAPDEDSILGLIGLGQSGLTDVSERHDDYLTQDLLDESRQ
jgi:metal-responsive CopG/Arc/MetJ family transcriptional regulator